MKINYNLSKDDYINFNIYNDKHSDSINKNLIMQRFITPLIFFIFPFIARVKIGLSLWYWLAIFSVIYILWTMFFPKYYIYNVKKGLSKKIREDEKGDLLGDKLIELREDDILLLGENSELKLKWDALERYVESDRYIFIYICRGDALIIPKRAFESEVQKEEFTGILNSKIDNKNM